MYAFSMIQWQSKLVRNRAFLSPGLLLSHQHGPFCHAEICVNVDHVDVVYACLSELLVNSATIQPNWLSNAAAYCHRVCFCHQQ